MTILPKEEATIEAAEIRRGEGGARSRVGEGGSTFEVHLVVSFAIDIAHQHIHAFVVSMLCHIEDLFKGRASCKEPTETPVGPSTD
jgi:hypothetical protein